MWADRTRMTADAVVAVQCDRTVTGVDTADGRLVWSAPLAEVPDYVRSTDTALVVAFENRVVVWDLATGTPRWEKAGLGAGGHPVAIDAERVYLTEGQSLAAYDVRDGTERWHAAVDVGVMVLDGDTLYVREFLHRVSAVDSATGATRWTSAGQFDGLTHTVVLGVTAGHLVLANDSNVIGFSLTTRTIAWTAPRGDGYAAAGSLVTMSDDGLAVTDVRRGVPMYDDAGAISAFAPAFDADGIVYVEQDDVITLPLPR